VQSIAKTSSIETTRPENPLTDLVTGIDAVIDDAIIAKTIDLLFNLLQILHS
jgi:hypothetical protein